MTKAKKRPAPPRSSESGSESGLGDSDGSSSSSSSDEGDGSDQRNDEPTPSTTTTTTTTTTTSSSASPSPPHPPPPSSSSIITKKTFASLGVVDSLAKACSRLKWETATLIQEKSIPAALEGRDVIGLAETGSGKTGAFAIPVLQALLDNPQKVFACVLAPTRELAFQIHEVFQGLGSGIGVSSVCITGGVDMMSQAIALARKPHIIVATPGRLVDHLENTKGFSMRDLKFLVMDEADRMLSMDFEVELDKILAEIPNSSRGRRTMLFSATMTSKVEKLQRASLVDPIKVEVSDKFQTPDKLIQNYLFIPARYKDCYLTYVMNDFSGKSILVFAATCNNAQRLALMLRNLNFPAVCLHGQMSQPKRLSALNKFKSGGRSILICTDVASRGLDIPSVDLVINFDLPGHGKDYIHRVGRTARAGRSGRAIAMVTQYDVEVYQRLEGLLGTKLGAYDCDEQTVLVFLERVQAAQRLATRELKEMTDSVGGGGRGKKGKGKGKDYHGDSYESSIRGEARGGYHNQRGGGTAKKKTKKGR